VRWIASRSLSSGAHSRDPLARNDGEGYTVIACDKREAFAQGRAATKQSSLSLRSEMDCFAALAMTERVTPSLRAKRSNPLFLVARIASRSLSSGARSRDPLARNDGEVPPSLPATNAKRLRKGAQRRSNPFFLEAWIASLRSQ
jgi:hypothetical protein